MKTNKITQAFIFAAGRGERMRPLTDSIPKPLVKIKDKAIIDYIIEKLEQIPSIKKIIINGFYLSEQIKNHIKNLHNPKIIFSQELEKIETGGGLMFAKDKIDLNQPILLINGDILWQDSELKSDIEILLDAWNQNECDIVLGLKKKEKFLGYEGEGDFNFDEKSGNISKGNNLGYVFTGLQIVNPKILIEKAPPEKCFSMSYFYKLATSANNEIKDIKAVEMNGKYFHIGTVAAIKQTEERL